MGDQFGTIQMNGYVSKTLKQVQLGQKSSFEWIGEEFLLPTDDPELPKEAKFPYTVVAHTKCVTYVIPEKSFGRIP